MKEIKFLSKDMNENNILSVLLYSNTIQQNLNLTNDYRDEINNYKNRRQNELQKISGVETNSKRLLTEIDNLEFKKNGIQGIQIVRKPVCNFYPVKPNLKLNVVLAFLIGIILMIFISFFLEYISRDKIQ